MHTLNQFTQQFTPYLHAFSHALACLGLGMEGAVAYDDDTFSEHTQSS